MAAIRFFILKDLQLMNTKAAAVGFTLALLLNGCLKPDQTPDDQTESSSSVKDTQLGAEQNAPECVSARHFIVSGTTEWRAVKQGGVLVNGTHPVTGGLQADSDSLRSAAMEFDFHPEQLTTGTELRDKRIQAIIFGVGLGLTLKFQLNKIEGSEEPKLPGPGQTREMTFVGTLYAAGFESAVKIPARMVQTDSGFDLTNGDEPIKFNVRTDLGISLPVDHLLSIAKTTMSDDIEVRFSLHLKPRSCAGQSVTSP